MSELRRRPGARELQSSLSNLRIDNEEEHAEEVEPNLSKILICFLLSILVCIMCASFLFPSTTMKVPTKVVPRKLNKQNMHKHFHSARKEQLTARIKKLERIIGQRNDLQVIEKEESEKLNIEQVIREEKQKQLLQQAQEQKDKIQISKSQLSNDERVADDNLPEEIENIITKNNKSSENTKDGNSVSASTTEALRMHMLEVKKRVARELTTHDNNEVKRLAQEQLGILNKVENIHTESSVTLIDTTEKIHSVEDIIQDNDRRLELDASVVDNVIERVTSKEDLEEAENGQYETNSDSTKNKDNINEEEYHIDSTCILCIGVKCTVFCGSDGEIFSECKTCCKCEANNSEPTT